MKYLVFVAMIACFFLPACATTNTADTAGQVTHVITTAQGLAHQLDDVYAFLVAQKAVPDNREAATRALAALDAIAPDVQAGADALTGDKINWAQFTLNAAVLAAKILGYVAPLVL